MSGNLNNLLWVISKQLTKTQSEVKFSSSLFLYSKLFSREGKDKWGVVCKRIFYEIIKSFKTNLQSLSSQQITLGISLAHSYLICEALNMLRLRHASFIMRTHESTNWTRYLMINSLSQQIALGILIRICSLAGSHMLKRDLCRRLQETRVMTQLPSPLFPKAKFSMALVLYWITIHWFLRYLRRKYCFVYNQA